jgi:hypothetical protein
MAPLLCWLIVVTHCGSGGAVRGCLATLVLPLQFTQRNAAAVSSRAEANVRIMEAPKGAVSMHVQFNVRTCRTHAAIVANQGEGLREEGPSEHRPRRRFVRFSPGALMIGRREIFGRRHAQ